jgi:uncharacterized protein YpbB
MNDVVDIHLECSEQLLLQLFKATRGQRGLTAVSQLLKGTPSHQAIWDAHLYQVTPWFGVLPQLETQQADTVIKQLMKKGLLTEEMQGKRKVIQLTNLGQEAAPTTSWERVPPLSFRADLQLERLLLWIQTLSHDMNASRSYQPVSRKPAVWHWIKAVRRSDLWKTAYDFIPILFQQLEELPENQRELLVRRMSGYGTVGESYVQMARATHRSVMDIQAELRVAIYQLLRGIQAKGYPMGQAFLANDLIGEGGFPLYGLTSSAKESARFLTHGMPIPELMKVRKLRLSTVQDHIIELALLNPDWSPNAYASEKTLQPYIDHVENSPFAALKELQDRWEGQADYFQLRLAQIQVWRKRF